MPRRTLVCLYILVSMLTSCSSSAPLSSAPSPSAPSPSASSCVCDAAWRVMQVVVVDQDNQPVDGAVLTITNVQTGNEMTVNRASKDPFLPKGTYIIFDDDMKPQIDEHGTPVRVVVTKAHQSATADYVLGTDPCQCHIQKLSGPDVIILTE